MLKAAMQYRDPEKIAIFLNQSNRATMNAMTVFKDVKQRLTPSEAKDLDLALDFMLNWSNKDDFEDQDIFKLTLWFKLNESKQQKTLAKLIK